MHEVKPNYLLRPLVDFLYSDEWAHMKSFRNFGRARGLVLPPEHKSFILMMAYSNLHTYLGLLLGDNLSAGNSIVCVSICIMDSSLHITSSNPSSASSRYCSAQATCFSSLLARISWQYALPSQKRNAMHE